jgi:hypothetical protein
MRPKHMQTLGGWVQRDFSHWSLHLAYQRAWTIYTTNGVTFQTTGTSTRLGAGRSWSLNNKILEDIEILGGAQRSMIESFATDSYVRIGTKQNEVQPWIGVTFRWLLPTLLLSVDIRHVTWREKSPSGSKSASIFVHENTLGLSYDFNQ